MFELIYKKYFKKGTLDIFLFSFLIFIVLNVISLKGSNIGICNIKMSVQRLLLENYRAWF